MDPADRALVEGICGGESAAARTVEGWVRLAASPFRSHLGADWEDAAQETLVEVIEGLAAGRFRGDGALRGWIWRITARNCLDRLRLRRRWVQVALSEELVPAAEAGVLGELLEAEGRSRLLALIARLPRGCRDLWREVLRGRSYREMSRIFGVSEGALRVRALRCRRRALELAEDEAGGNAKRGATP